MLKHLLLRNIALVEELSLSFESGLNVLTGETGAGKSIIIDSVNFLLGAKADKDNIRTGESRAYVEGCFDISGNEAAKRYMEEQAIEDEDGLLTLSRELQLAGRSVSRVNGVAVNLGQLRGLSALLLDIHGQHDHQSLLDEKHHLGFLDDFGEAPHQDLLLDTREKYKAYSAADQALRESLSKNASRQDRMDALQKKVKDISDANVEPGEEDRLKTKLEQLRNADKIRRGLKSAFVAVYEGGHDEQAALNQIGEAKRALDEIAGFSEEIEKARDRMDSLFYELEDLSLELREMLHDLDADEGALQAANERIDLLRRLSRRYAVSGDELISALEEAEKELKQLITLDEDIEKLEMERDKALSAYDQAAEKLSQSRQKLAASLSRRMEEQLEALNMSGTRFMLAFQSVDHPSAEGKDSVRMLMAPNKGEEAKPLSKIASGGETSRLMLALKSIAAERTQIPAMIFDEIDTGISGRTAQVVAEKLWDIAQYRQVLCVTHLQQIACMATSHFLVEKKEQSGRTQTFVNRIDGSERVQEISRILSGFGEDSQSSLTHAQHMLDAAHAYREGKGKA